ncbi:aminodeoxychorismate lyase [Peribacillus sp. NPDC097675]|uniref:aminodeoxychorismate lyase n=1 Tax=Peribacillus sp. NPDC097675 TaxID=3390618 RepID=UPI003CFECD97
MTSKSMRSFAGGLFVAAGICGAVYFFDTEETANTQTLEKLTVDEMKSKLTSEGYVIHTEKEYEEQLDELKSNQAVAEDKGPKEKIIYRSVLKVSKGMTSIDVGKNLKRSRIIADAKEFFDEVEKRGKANNLRPGSYVIDSEMTTEEIISKVFK